MRKRELRLEQINIRMTSTERAKVETAALIYGVPLSSWIRRVVLMSADVKRDETRRVK